MSKFYCPSSAGNIEIHVDGDIGGNSQRTIIRLREGQFDGAKVSRLRDGIQVEIYGVFEMSELTSALVKHLKSQGDLNGWTEQEKGGANPP